MPTTPVADSPKLSASEMVDRCFRHQHPEAYGGSDLPDAAIPPHLRHGAGEIYVTSPPTPEEQMGNPEAVPLP